MGKKIMSYQARIYRIILYLLCIVSILTAQGCAGVATFPTVAHAGDTVSVMVGGTEKARKETIQVVLTDANGLDWDLQSLGLIRSVFNLRPDARAEVSHYASFYLESDIAWTKGHEPVQTVLVVDLPTNVPAGASYLTVNHFSDDDSSGVVFPYIFNIDVIPGSGAGDDFLRQDAFLGGQAVDFSRLEPAPYAKISFGSTEGLKIGAVSIIVDFDETVLPPDDVNVYTPESSVRGSVSSSGAFGNNQRMLYWRQDGSQILIDIVSPQGIKQKYLMAYIIHPRGLSGEPGFNIVSSKVYDVNGNEVSFLPTLEYFP